MNPFFRFQRQLLILAAILNFALAIMALVSTSFFNSQFFKFAPDPRSTFPYLALYHYLFWGMVLVMGIAFLMAAVEPVKNKALLFICSLGKIIIAGFCLMLFIQGHGKWLMLTVGIMDGIFGLLLLCLFFGKNGEAA